MADKEGGAEFKWKGAGEPVRVVSPPIHAPTSGGWGGYGAGTWVLERTGVTSWIGRLLAPPM